MNEIMFYGGIVGAVLFGALAVFLFIRFRILDVISSLTGLGAKRSIQKLHQEIEFQSNTNPIIARSGKTTLKLHKGRSGKKAAEELEETTILTEETTVLTEETTVLTEETTVLTEETTLLTEEGSKSLFYVVQNVEIINTEERI